MPRPPRARGHWLVGVLGELSRDRLGTMTAMSRLGDVVEFRAGPVRALMVYMPELVERVLVDEARAFKKDRVQRMSRPIFGNGLFLSEGDFWKRQRRMAQPAFHKARIARYADLMVAHANGMVDCWADGGELELLAELTALTMRIAARALFDTDVAETAPLAAAMSEAMLAIKSLFTAAAPLPSWAPFGPPRRLRRARAAIDACVNQFIAERRARPDDDRGDLLSLLLAARDDDGEPMSDAQLRDEVATLFLAGFETTATTLAWALWELARRPALDGAVAAEVRAAWGARPPRYDDLAKLRLCDAVIKETLRLYPPAYGIGREAATTVELGGYRVKKGTPVYVSPWVAQRDRRWWPEPERFWPERWLDGDAIARLPKFAYFPFGGGPRICIGNAFATMEATLALATVVQRVRLAAAPGPPVTPVPLFTLRPSGPMRVRVHARAGADKVASG